MVLTHIVIGNDMMKNYKQNEFQVVRELFVLFLELSTMFIFVSDLLKEQLIL